MTEATRQQYSTVTIVIPAAGLSRRFRNGNKLLQPVDGEPVIGRTVRNAVAAGAEEIVVVAGLDREKVERAVGKFGIRLVFNPDFESGLASSIVCGVQAAAPNSDILIWPGDMPFVSGETAARITAAGGSASIVAPVVAGRRGHPVYFGSSFRNELLLLSGDRGAREILLRHPDSVREIEVTSTGVLTDVDTVGDLRNAKL